MLRVEHPVDDTSEAERFPRLFAVRLVTPSDDLNPPIYRPAIHQTIRDPVSKLPLESIVTGEPRLTFPFPSSI
jgi:hypothetical protein